MCVRYGGRGFHWLIGFGFFFVLLLFERSKGEGRGGAGQLLSKVFSCFFLLVLMSDHFVFGCIGIKKLYFWFYSKYSDRGDRNKYRKRERERERERENKETGKWK